MTTGNGDGTGQGSPGGGPNGSAGAHVQTNGQSNVTGQPASSSGGGSSPLIPILIAILALAAISVGAVMYRQRRGPGGSATGPASPKAS
ncbi:MAG: hypothetical protein ACRDLL_05265 [Solirubrobacterales bacterium]